MATQSTSATARDAAIYVAGHRGLAGSALVRALHANGYTNIIRRTHAELDLTDARTVAEFFRAAKPEAVILAAAKVGGIVANSTLPAEFIRDNLAIQTNVIHEAWRAGVQRLLFLGSSCIYPRDCAQPIREEYLLTGPLEPTNRPYAIAKIAGVEMCWSYNRQYGTQYLCAMPTNLYGPGDNYDLQTSHVLPALIRKFHDAKVREDKTVTLWGTGSPRREFLYSDDMAAACVHLLELLQEKRAAIIDDIHPPLLNIGCGEDLSIRELAELVRRIVGWEGDIVWDRAKPDGTPRKLLDVSKLSALGWRRTIALEDGIRRAYADFLRQPVTAPG
jgi:GDP-L-fucose synthase